MFQWSQFDRLRNPARFADGPVPQPGETHPVAPRTGRPARRDGQGPRWHYPVRRA